jgi:hypothetical protein
VDVPYGEVHESAQRTCKKDGKTIREHGNGYAIEKTLGFYIEYV